MIIEILKTVDTPYRIMRFDKDRDYSGGDIDILALDNNIEHELALAVIEYNKDYRVVRVEESYFHVKIDVYKFDDFYVRFDIYYRLIYTGVYRFYSGIERVIFTTSEERYNGLKLCPTHVEMALRYVEYLNLYETIPTKVKHHEWVLEKLESDLETGEKFYSFIDLWLKIDMMQVKAPPKQSKMKYAKEVYHKIRTKSASELVRALKNRVR